MTLCISYCNMYNADVLTPLTLALPLGNDRVIRQNYTHFFHQTELILYLYTSQAHPRTPGDTPTRRRACTEPVRNGPLPERSRLVIYRTEALPEWPSERAMSAGTGDAPAARPHPQPGQWAGLPPFSRNSPRAPGERTGCGVISVTVVHCIITPSSNNKNLYDMRFCMLILQSLFLTLCTYAQHSSGMLYSLYIYIKYATTCTG